MVKTHVLSLQSRGRCSATDRTRRAAYSLTWRSRYGEAGLHAADRSRIREQCAGVDGWDAPRSDDGSGQRTDRGHSAGYASTDVGPNLCPGLPFIRSTRGSSYEDDSNLTRRYLLTSFVASRERERASETRLEPRSCSSSRTAQGAACNSAVIHIYRLDRQE